MTIQVSIQVKIQIFRRSPWYRRKFKGPVIEKRSIFICYYHQQHEKTPKVAYLAMIGYGTLSTVTARKVKSFFKSHVLKTTFIYHNKSNFCPIKLNGPDK